ncbi:DUF2088 domain-containing protein [bacterium]|nr:DUF2088 domain-containing protein [bacterium]
MHVKLPFGDDMLPVDVPDNWINGRCYRSHRYEQAGDERAELLAAFNDPIGIDSFERLVAGRSNAVVAIDSSAPGLFPEFLGEFLEELEEASSLDAKDILVLLTNFYWNPSGRELIEELVPQDIRDRYPVALHDPTDYGASREIGNVLDHYPLRINTGYLDADLKIVIGPVYPHLLRGFSGGRAVITPGLANEDTLRHMYSFENVSDPNVVYGIIRDNPFHKAGLDAMGKAGCDVAVSVMMTPEGKLSRVVVGEPGQSHIAAVGMVREMMNVSLKEPMDIVVTGGGGAPHDATVLQMVNVLSAVLPALKDDGTIVLTAKLADGIGPDPLRDILLHCDGPRSFREKYSKPENFTPGQWVAQVFYQILAKHEVIVLADGMSEDELWATGMTPTSDLQEAVEVAMQGHGQRCKICALPDGPFTLVTVAPPSGARTPGIPG